MFSRFTRDTVQIVSFAMFSLGVTVLLIHGSGWVDDIARSVAISLMAGSIWFNMTCESTHLTKVQNEMHCVLEELSVKREREISDLLFFLRSARSIHNPWESIEGAKSFIKKLGLPAAVNGSDGIAIEVNDDLLSILGYDRKEFLKTPAHIYHRQDLYGMYLNGISNQISKEKTFMHSRFSFIRKDGEEVPGTVAVIVLPDRQGAVGIFLPDSLSIIDLSIV